MLPNVDWLEIGHAGLETLQMLGGSLFFTIALGLPLGLALYMTLPGSLYASRRLYGALSLGVNVLRSLPFIILLIVMIPLTLVLTGTSIGVAGAIPPLVVGAAPFFGRSSRTCCAKSTANRSRRRRPWARPPRRSSGASCSPSRCRA